MTLLRRRGWSSKYNNRLCVRVRELCAWILFLVTLILYVIQSKNTERYTYLDQRPYPTLRAIDVNKKGWHGGSPNKFPRGSCWCGEIDKYCMCTPSLAIDAVIVEEGNSQHVWLVKRKDTGQHATVGGFVEVGESVEDALIREVKEETGLHITVSQVALLGVYSDSRRDLRRHTASAVFVVTLPRGSQLRAGDDAKDVEFVSIHDIPSLDMFSDHKSILGDFLHYISNNDSIDAEVIPDSGVPFTRSVCTSQVKI